MPRVIAGTARGIKLETIKDSEMRPTTDRLKEAAFSGLHMQISEGEIKSFLDLFAGSGQNGIEAKSRGVDQVYLVEQNRNAIQVIKKNLQKTKLDAEVIASSAQLAIQRLIKEKITFDIIYFDPPWPKLSCYWQETEMALAKILKRDGKLFIEYSAKTSLQINPAIWQVYKEKKYGFSKLLILKKVR